MIDNEKYVLLIRSLSWLVSYPKTTLAFLVSASLYTFQLLSWPLAGVATGAALLLGFLVMTIHKLMYKLFRPG